MKKKIFTILCVSIMALSLSGCDKDDKNKERKTTEVTEQAEGGDLDLPVDEDDSTIEEPDTEATVDSDWKLGGDEKTGYMQVPAAWSEHTSIGEDEQYSLQYVNDEQNSLVSLVRNDYGFDSEKHNVVRPAEYVRDYYISQYEAGGGENLSTDKLYINGVEFYKTVDLMPADTYYPDEDYYLYTYVAYENDRFYTIIVEGVEDYKDLVDEAAVKAEETFTIDGTTDTPGLDNGDTEGDSGDSQAVPSQAGTEDWENGKITFDGVTYTLPCDFSELEANGWYVADYYSDTLVSYDDYEYIMITNGEEEVSVLVSNKYSQNDISPSECEFAGILIDFLTEDMDCSVAGGVCLGSSYDDVIAAFGTPDDIYEDDEEDYQVLTYNSEKHYMSLFEVTIENGVVTELDITCW